MRPHPPPQLKRWPCYSSYSIYSDSANSGHRPLPTFGPNNFSKVFLHRFMQLSHRKWRQASDPPVLLTRQLQEISKSVLCPLRCLSAKLLERFPVSIQDYIYDSWLCQVDSGWQAIGHFLLVANSRLLKLASDCIWYVCMLPKMPNLGDLRRVPTGIFYSWNQTWSQAYSTYKMLSVWMSESWSRVFQLQCHYEPPCKFMMCQRM